MPKVYYKTYYRCNGPLEPPMFAGKFGKEVNTRVNSYTFNGLLNPNGTYSAAPAWFAQINFFPLGDTFWQITTPTEANTAYQFSWTAHNKNGTTDEYIVELVMLDFCAVPVQNQNCSKVKVLTWLTREGGWAYFSFSGNRTFEVKIPQGKTFQSSDYVLRYNTRPDVYTGMQLTTGPIPEQALDLLESLKYSVQAYFIEDGGSAPLYMPIVIQDGDFTKRKTTDKRFDVTVKFIFAEQVQIQTQ